MEAFMRSLTMLICSTVAAFASALPGVAAAGEPQFIDVYTSREDGYFMYRIPSAVVTNAGTVLAFAEGRKVNGADNGDIDVLVKRSTDGGQTWSDQTLIWDDGEATCGNPTSVVDRHTGTIWLAMNRNEHGYVTRRDGEMGTRTVWLSRSDDDGVTWSEPVDITAIAKESTWVWHGVGPGVGIQLERGEHAGRLLIPCYHSDPADPHPRSRGSALYSDDHGQTWKRSESFYPGAGENQFVELADGRVMVNARSGRSETSRRRMAISEDGGVTWSPVTQIDELPEPPCQGSILRYTWPEEDGRSRILFSNPANDEGRTRLTVRVSYDEGETWPVSKLVYADQAAYSSLVRLPDGRIGCLFERDRYRYLTLAILTLDWLADGRDTLGHGEAAAANSAIRATTGERR